MQMGKNVSVILMVAMVLVATIMAPTTMAIRENIPMHLATREQGLPVIPQVQVGGGIKQQLAELMLGATERNALRCIPQYNRCGPAMDGVPCCEPYTCTSQYYGNCS